MDTPYPRTIGGTVPADVLTRLCPHCTAPNPANATFCGTCGQPLVDPGKAQHYYQSPWHLALLSILTCGLYDLYWFNRTWRMLRELTHPPRFRQPPLLLTLGLLVPILNIYLIYQTFKAVRAGMPPVPAIELSASRLLQWAESFGPGGLTAVYVGMGLALRLPGPLWLLSLANVIALLAVQAQVNRLVIARRPDVNTARPLTGWQIGVLIVGGLVVALAVVGSFLP